MADVNSLKTGPISGYIVTVWAACWSDSDHDFDWPRAYYLDRAAAVKKTIGAGWCKANGSVSEELALKVGDAYYLLSRKAPIKVVDPATDKLLNDLKARAMAKLDEYELKAILSDKEDEEDEDE